MNVSRTLLCFVVSATSLLAFAADQHHHDAYDPNHLGVVDFPVSCAAGVQSDFNKGVALLHSFWYAEAAKQFAAIAQRDPKCAMAYWGEAMSRWHQLWDSPSESEIRLGQRELDEAVDNPAKTERERELIGAARAYFWRRDDSTPEQRAQAYSEAMAKVHQRFPKDTEITLFYALSLLAAAPPMDSDIALRKQAAALLEPIFLANPQHPGAAHYLIHAYDTPQLAELGLPAARAYAKVAPSAPHALHMPSHIFSRVGMWKESIASNLASIAATKHSAAMHMGGADHQMHAMDFLQYAYLQSGQEEKAAALTSQLDQLHATDGDEWTYTRATMAVRYALETRDWKRAADLEVPATARPWLEATVRAARAEGAARSGDLKEAQREVSRLKQMEANLRHQHTDEAVLVLRIVSVRREEAEAWWKHARGKDREAIAEMHQAALADEKTGGEGVQMPGYEQYADLLMEAGHPAEALQAYEQDLKLAPNRFDALYGAARAAQAAGNNEVAQLYFSALVKCAPDSSRPELAAARAVLAREVAAGGQ